MQTKRIIVFFITLLVLSMLPHSSEASSDTTASFQGGGVKVHLTYPEEAHPTENIWHNVTLTSTDMTTLQNFTVVVKAPVNSGWVEILSPQDTFSKPLPLTYNLNFSLPQDASGMLQCFIFVNTSSIGDLSTTVYTTLTSDPIFSDMLATYSSLLEDFEVKLAEYNNLLAKYTALVTDYDDISGLYDDQVAAYTKKLAEFKELNETHYELQANYTTLETNFEDLNTSYTDLYDAFVEKQGEVDGKQDELNSDKIVMIIFVISLAVLIAFIVYLKRKKEDPYLVIRKETVSMKSDKET